VAARTLLGGLNTAEVTASVDLSPKRKIRLTMEYLEVFRNFALLFETMMPDSSWVMVASSYLFDQEGIDDFMASLDDLVAMKPNQFVERKSYDISGELSKTTGIKRAKLREIVSIDPETFRLQADLHRMSSMSGAVVEIYHQESASGAIVEITDSPTKQFVIVNAEGWWSTTYDCNHPHLQQMHGGMVDLTKADAKYLKVLLEESGAPSWCWPRIEG